MEGDGREKKGKSRVERKRKEREWRLLFLQSFGFAREKEKEKEFSSTNSLFSLISNLFPPPVFFLLQIQTKQNVEF